MNKTAIKRYFPAVFLLLLIAGTIAAYIRNSNDVTNSPVGYQTNAEFFSFKPEQVRAIKISGGGDTDTIQSKNNVWILPESNGAYASRQTVIEFLTQLSKTRPLRMLETADDATLKNLNLSRDPKARLGVGGGIDVQLTGEKGVKIAALTLGKAHIRREHGTLKQNNKLTYDGRYVRFDKNDGSPAVYLIGRVFDRCMPAAAYWIEPLKIPTVNNVFRIQYSRMNEKGRQQVVWSVIPNARKRTFSLLYPPGKPLSLNDLARRLQVLGAPFSRDLVPTEKTKGLKFTDELHIFTSSGQVYVLAMAKMPEKGNAAATLRISLIPNRLRRAQGESDADYQKRVRRLSADMEYERQAFAGRIFYIKEDLMTYLAAIPEEKPVTQKGTGK